MSIIRNIKRLGLTNIFFAFLKKIYFFYLRNKYQFGYWHAYSPIESKPYKSQVIEIANSLKPNSLIEVGCGLGEILSRILSDKKIGVDSDRGVIEAAKYLQGNEIHFIHHDFKSINSLRLPINKVDLLLMINWTHEISWDILESNIRKLNSFLDIKYLLIDIIKEGVPGYPFHHTKEDLCKLGEVTDIVEGEDGVRDICSIRILQLTEIN